MNKLHAKDHGHLDSRVNKITRHAKSPPAPNCRHCHTPGMIRLSLQESPTRLQKGLYIGRCSSALQRPSVSSDVSTEQWTTPLPQLVITGRPARSAAMPVLFKYSTVQNGFFAPQGRYGTPINVKFGTGEQIRLSGENVGIQPPKLSKFRILARNLYLRGDSFAIF